MKMQSPSTPINSRSQDYSVTLAKIHFPIVFNIFECFSSDTVWAILGKFHMRPSGNWGKKIYTSDPCHTNCVYPQKYSSLEPLGRLP